MRERINIGCIGCGFMGTIQMRNAMRMRGVSIHAVADVRETAARKFHRQFRSRYWTTDPNRLFEDPDLHAVLICTYPPSHADLAVRGAHAGKHILLEKPMAVSAAECLRIIRACKSSGVKLSLDLKFRFSTAVRKVKDRIPRPFLVASQTSMEKMRDEHYHMDPELGGGIVENLGAHSLDLTCFFAGSEPVRVFARGRRLPGRKKTLFDAVIGSIDFANDCLANFIISDCGEWSYTSKWFYEVADGDKSAVVFNHCRSALFNGCDQCKVGGSRIPPHEVGSYGVLEDFVCAIRECRPPQIRGEDGLRVALLSEAIFSSISSGKMTLVAVSA